MFGMFKDLGAMAGLMKQLPKIQEEMQALQTRLGQVTAEGDAGGGMVKAKANGKMELVSCTLSDEALKSGDRELLEDLIKAAVNQAFERVRALVAEETGKAAGNLGLPMGMLPGMGGGGGELPGQ
jgi:DNA-binding YbaB/EbfC family protein